MKINWIKKSERKTDEEDIGKNIQRVPKQYIRLVFLK